MKQKKRAQTRLFLAVFMALVVFVIVRDLLREKKVALSVTDNAGVTVLETIDNSLICVFQDGQVTTWDWNKLPQQQGRFQAASAQAVILDAQHIAAVNKEGQKALYISRLGRPGCLVAGLTRQNNNRFNSSQQSGFKGKSPL
jgi:hypothetical protein